MAGDGASEITREQVMAAISDRNRALLKISRRRAAGPHPHPEQLLADLRMLRSVISNEMSDLCVVLRGLRLGDLAFMEEIPRGRLDELLGARTDRVARLRGVPLETRLLMEAASRACKIAVEMPLRSSSVGAVMTASDAPPSARVGQMDAATAEVNQDVAAAAPVQSDYEGLVRLRTDELLQLQWTG